MIDKHDSTPPSYQSETLTSYRRFDGKIYPVVSGIPKEVVTTNPQEQLTIEKAVNDSQLTLEQKERLDRVFPNWRKAIWIYTNYAKDTSIYAAELLQPHREHTKIVFSVDGKKHGVILKDTLYGKMEWFMSEAFRLLGATMPRVLPIEGGSEKQLPHFTPLHEPKGTWTKIPVLPSSYALIEEMKGNNFPSVNLTLADKKHIAHQLGILAGCEFIFGGTVDTNKGSYIYNPVDKSVARIDLSPSMWFFTKDNQLQSSDYIYPLVGFSHKNAEEYLMVEKSFREGVSACARMAVEKRKEIVNLLRYTLPLGLESQGNPATSLQGGIYISHSVAQSEDQTIFDVINNQIDILSQLSIQSPVEVTP